MRNANVAGSADESALPEALRVALVLRLRARREEIDREILARVRDAILDPAGSGDPHYLEGLRAAAIAAVDYVLAGIERPADSSEPPPAPEPVLAQARRAARAGVGLDTALRRYVAGYALLDDFVICEAEHDSTLADAAVLRQVFALTARLVDQLIAAVAQAYKQELDAISAAPVSSPPVPRPLYGTQRERILQAVVQVVGEYGFQSTSVALVTSRARVSNSTFYECFDGLQDCFTAVLDLGLELPSTLIVTAFQAESSWQDGIRAALAALLTFFDSEPQLTRVWFGESMAAGSWALEHRERNIAAVQALIVEYWFTPDSPPIDPVLVRGVLSSVLAAITTHVVTKHPDPLIVLLAPLTSLVLSPFLTTDAVKPHLDRAEELTRELLSQRSSPLAPTAPIQVQHAQVPGGRRAAACLLYLAEHAAQSSDAQRGPSNSQIAAAVGIAHSGQVSTLLVRLANQGLLVKDSGDPGRPNAWRLTATGEHTARLLQQHS